MPVLVTEPPAPQLCAHMPHGYVPYTTRSGMLSPGPRMCLGTQKRRGAEGDHQVPASTAELCLSLPVVFIMAFVTPSSDQSLIRLKGIEDSFSLPSLF